MSTRTEPPAPRTLADQLRGWSDERLGALLASRPDLAAPVPQDSAQLAARLATRPSVVRGLDALDACDLAVLEAAVHTAPSSTEVLAEVVHAAPGSVKASVERLLDRVLLWGRPEELRPVSTVADVIGAVHGPETADVPHLLEGVSGPARALLDHLDQRDADGRTESVTEPIRELAELRLVVLREDRRHVTVPWTVRVALRGGRSTRDPVDVPPPVPTTERDPALVARAAAGAAFELVRRTELLMDHWGVHPPGVLRAGGVGVRDLRAAADLLGIEPAEAGLVLETATAAGLLAPGSADDVDPAWLPTAAFDAWVSVPVAERWRGLVDAWLANPRQSALVGGRDSTNKPVNALSEGLERAWLVTARRDTLAALAGIDGTLATGTGVPALLARLRWRHPRRPPAREPALVATLAEAAFLGVTGLGGLPSYAVALLAGDHEAAVTELAGLLPDPVDHVLIQADLTAVAPGPLTQELAQSLSLVADVESRGGATVYRFGADTVRRAFDSGWSALEIKDFLASSSRTPVPQALDYLVDDVARRFGTLRAGAVGAFLRSDDEAALTALVHDAGATALRLRRIAPTVLVSDVPLHVLLPKLRELGHAPVVEAPDGSVHVARPDVFRSRAKPARRPGAFDQARQVARTTAMVAAIRSGDRVAANRPVGASATSPGDVLALLRRTASSGTEVLLDYVDNHGRRVERVVRPVRVEGGQLVAHDDREQELRSFAVHRIGSVRLVPPGA